MGVYIKGMEMPTNCWLCPLSVLLEKPREMLFCRIIKEEVLRNKVDGNCPIVEVPTPHGDLIDRDALTLEFDRAQRTMQQDGQEYSCSFMSSSQEISTEWYCVEDMVENAPTIIEAERGEA